ncbi:MAG: sulfatase [bacterium]|nr:sulfatase [bacterium]
MRTIHRFRARCPLCLACLLLAAVIAGLPGCRRESMAPRRQVLLILIDAARPDHFSTYGYARTTTPEMDRVAADAVVFRHHYAQGTGTRVSIPSLLYSRYYGLPIFPNDPQVPYSAPAELFRRGDDAQISIAKAFESAGFKTAAISAHFWTGEDTPFAMEFMEMHDLSAGHEDSQYPYPRARDVIDFAIQWITANHERDYFLYIHLMDVHFPHYFESEAQRFFDAAAYDAENFQANGGLKVPATRLSADDLRYATALYDGSLRYLDRHLGRLFAFLRYRELIANTTIAITADHGENLLDGPDGRVRDGVTMFSHGGPWLEPVARIPLIIHAPRRLESGDFDQLSEGIDVGPTLLALADVSLPEGKELDGIDLAAVINGGTAPKDQVLIPRAIRTSAYKCLFSVPDSLLLDPEVPEVDELRGRLFDLASDPGETVNRFASEPEVVEGLLQRYRRVMTAPYQRSRAARTSEQPRAAFAISVKHAVTDVALPPLKGMEAPQGWSRVRGEPHSVLVARNTEQPLTVRFRLPNGSYLLSLRMWGQATVEVNGEQRELAAEGDRAEFGAINVTEGTFRATIRPAADQLLRVFFFGFVPPGAGTDPEQEAQRLRRLRALGYV